VTKYILALYAIGTQTKTTEQITLIYTTLSYFTAHLKIGQHSRTTQQGANSNGARLHRRGIGTGGCRSGRARSVGNGADTRVDGAGEGSEG